MSYQEVFLVFITWFEFGFFFLQGVETDPHLALTLPPDAKPAKAKVEDPVALPTTEELSIRIGRGGAHSGKPPFIHPSSAISAKS